MRAERARLSEYDFGEGYENIWDFINDYQDGIVKYFRRGGFRADTRRVWMGKDYYFTGQLGRVGMKELGVRIKEKALVVDVFDSEVNWVRGNIFDILNITANPATNRWVLNDQLGFKKTTRGLYHWEKRINKGDEGLLPSQIGRYLKSTVDVLGERGRVS